MQAIKVRWVIAASQRSATQLSTAWIVVRSHSGKPGSYSQGDHKAGSPAMIGQITSAKASKRWLPVPAVRA